MGYAEVELDPPSQFLKKHTRKEMRPFVGKAYINSNYWYYVIFIYLGWSCKFNAFVCIFNIL
jgi:hypothetical protein